MMFEDRHSLSLLPQPAAVSGLRPVVLFIGSSVGFSDRLLRMVTLEFSDLDPRRLPNPEALKTLSAADLGRLRVVIVDQQFAAMMHDEAGLLRRATAGRVPLVLAYRDASVIRDGFRADPEAASRIGYLPMNMQFDAWLAILRLAILGERYLPCDVMNGAAATEGTATATEEQQATLDALSPRERQVLALLSEGKQNKIIACELGLSGHTVKLHIHNIIAKLGVTNRTEAAVQYHASCPPGQHGAPS